MEDYKSFSNLWNKHWFTKDIPIKIFETDQGMGISDIYGVRGFLMPTDIYFLWYLGLTLPKDGKYLEIGSWLGLSAVAVAFGLISNSNFNAKIYCVDPWEIMPEQNEFFEELKNVNLLEVFNRNIEKLNVKKYIIPLKGKSTQIASEINQKDFDVIFIDAEHTFESCYEDILTWLPKLKTGGKMFGHDASPGGGVRKALEQIRKEKNFSYSIIDYPYSHYIWELHLHTTI